MNNSLNCRDGVATGSAGRKLRSLVHPSRAGYGRVYHVEVPWPASPRSRRPSTPPYSMSGRASRPSWPPTRSSARRSRAWPRPARAAGTRRWVPPRPRSARRRWNWTSAWPPPRPRSRRPKPTWRRCRPMSLVLDLAARLRSTAEDLPVAQLTAAVERLRLASVLLAYVLREAADPAAVPTLASAETHLTGSVAALHATRRAIDDYLAAIGVAGSGPPP